MIIGKKVQIQNITNFENGGIEDLSKDYYEIIAFTFSDTDYFCIWCDPEDGDPHFETKGKRLFFQLEKKPIADYIYIKGSSYENTTEYDFNNINCDDCNDYLNKWNIIDDLSKTLKIDFIGNHDNYTDLYSKFVYGSNLPTMNNIGIEYIPSFDKEEKQQIENVTKDMIRILKLALEIDD